jgi:uncharacterized membrane protein YjjP (DUF1212 family)
MTVPLDEFLVELGADLIRSSQTVDDVEQQLTEIGQAAGVERFDVMALPTAIMLESDDTGRLRSRVRSVRERGLRLDQVDAVDDLARRARQGHVTPDDGMAELERIRASRPPYGWVVRSLGLGVLAGGFSLALQPTTAGLVLALVLGTLVGVVVSLDLPGLGPVTPALLSFGVALAVFGLDSFYEGENPIRLLIPPLLIFLPGAKITTGTIELAQGSIVSGSSRLVSGLIDLLLLSTAIVAAGALVGVARRDLTDVPSPQFGAWTLAPALVLIAIGYHVHSSAKRSAVPWILLVLAVALGAERLAAEFVAPSVSAFFGAMAMTPIVLAVDRRPAGPRAMVLFLPGFYLLVPGATGLIDFTQTVGPSFSGGDLTSTMVTVVSIALGVLVAVAGFDAVVEGRAALRLLGSGGGTPGSRG